jgi:4-diphosphocytidyl-2-C-methyl-D-erythritol kinase
MLSFPNCKINLGLRILRKRTDGFHDLETVFYPLPLKEALEIIHAPENDSASGVQFSMSGAIQELPSEDNICVKAYHILQKDFPQLPPIKMHLHKMIPAGAGLGGGSADGAFALNLLNERFNLGLNAEQLRRYALQLGSDCPFFIFNKPCVATSRGEILEKINLDLSNYKFVLVNPNIHISTAWAFSQITPTIPKHSVKEILKQPIETWTNELINDFEMPVFKNYPEIKKIKEGLYTSNAVYAGMSGSGSTVFGIFKKEMKTSFSFPAHYFVKELFSELH